MDLGADLNVEHLKNYVLVICFKKRSNIAGLC